MTYSHAEESILKKLKEVESFIKFWYPYSHYIPPVEWKNRRSEEIDLEERICVMIEANNIPEESIVVREYNRIKEMKKML